MKVIVDTKELKEYSATLKRISRSAFPVAIRETINDLAFDYKKRTLPDTWNDVMTVRHRTFLKSHSGVVKSQNTFDINQMESSAGTLSKDLAGRQLEMQEEGGTLKERAVPRLASRTGRNNHRRIKRKLQYKRFSGMVKSGRTGAAIHSVSENTKRWAIIITKDRRVVVVDNKEKDRKSQDKYSTLYTSKGKDAKIKRGKHAFNETSAEKTMIRMPDIFEKHALKQIRKYLRRK